MTRGSNCLDDEGLDRLFHALADRTRRDILRQLSQGAANVSELAEPFEMSLPAVSKHLKVLEKAGLIERRVEGRVHHCTLNAQALKDVEVWLESYRVFWNGTLEALAGYVEAESERS